MDKTSWVFAGLLLFSGYGIARSLMACSPLIGKGSRIFVTGDSLAVGLDMFMRKLAKKNRLAYDALVYGGTSTFQWTNPNRGLLARMQTFKPTVVIVSLGTNDSMTQFKEPRHRSEIKKLIEMIRGVGAIPYWVLPPKLPWKQNFSQWVRDEKIRVFESEQVHIPMGPDNIHPTGAGYAGWAGLIWQDMACAETAPNPMAGVPVLAGPMVPSATGIFKKR
jgi:hypothetical protein